MKVWHVTNLAAPPAAVFRALSAPDSVVSMFRELGYVEVRVVDRSDRCGVSSLLTRREVPVVAPVFASRFFSPSHVIEQHEVWDAPRADGTYQGTWQVTARGVPVTAGGVQRLVPRSDGGTVWEVEGEVVSPMPSAGARLAELVVFDLHRTLDEQGRHLAKALAVAVDL